MKLETKRNLDGATNEQKLIKIFNSIKYTRYTYQKELTKLGRINYLTIPYWNTQFLFRSEGTNPSQTMSIPKVQGNNRGSFIVVAKRLPKLSKNMASTVLVANFDHQVELVSKLVTSYYKTIDFCSYLVTFLRPLWTPPGQYLDLLQNLRDICRY